MSHIESNARATTADDRPLRLYLAGKVLKDQRRPNELDWREGWQRILERFGRFEFLSPVNPDLDEGRPEIVFGHDCWLVQNSDVLVVDASHKLGTGTSQEMLVAKYFGKPVVTVLPPDSHHRRPVNSHGHVVKNWRHPFIVCTSDALFDSIEDLGHWLATVSTWNLPAKGIGVIDEAITTYLQQSRGVKPTLIAA